MKRVYAMVCILILLGTTINYVSAQTKKPRKKKAEVTKIDTIQVAKVPPRKAPIVPFRDTIFYIYGNIGSFTPEQRASAIGERIREMEGDPFFKDDSVKLIDTGENINIIYKNGIIATVDTVQAEVSGKTKTEIAQILLDEILNSIQKQREETSFRRIAIQIFGVAGIIFAEYFIIKGIFYCYRRIKIYVRLQQGKKIKGALGIIDARREVLVIVWLLKFLRFIVIITSLYLCLLILFKLFPHTMSLSDELLGYVISPIKVIARKAINYMPKLFTILVIVTIFWYIRKFLRSIAQQLSENKITIKGFYPDWAFPTYNIVCAILFVFMFILIFPYLPESDSSIFQGVSVFAGIIISLGSTSVIGNLIAGLVITYMRPFRIGDRIKMDDCIGNVVEKSALVTRVKTVKNEIITIPNSSVMSSKTVNYSQSAREYGLILYTTVTIGYEVPWQNVHELLLKVAQKTEHLSKKQKPFIMQNALDEFYVEYQLNVYTKDADKMNGIYSDLRKNIQDIFAEAGIDLLSPHYRVNKNI